MEELDFQALLDRFRGDGFQKGEQVILANFGTNQTLLSLIFQEPANVKNITIEEKEGGLARHVDLIAGEQMVGYATTYVPGDRNSKEVWEAVKAGQLGLGQIVVTFNLPSKRVLVDVGHDDKAFWRSYKIEGPDVFFEINENYPRQPFEEIGWLQKPGSSMSVTDDDGQAYNFSKFIALGVQEDGGIFLGVEDKGLTKQEAMDLVLDGAQALGHISSSVTETII